MKGALAFIKQFLKIFNIILLVTMFSIDLKYTYAQAPVPCNNRDIQFGPYRNVAPAAGVTTATFYTNDLSNSVEIVNTGIYSSGKPTWGVQGSQSVLNNLISITAGTGSITSNQKTTMTFATASNQYIFQVADLNAAAGEEVEVTGFDMNGAPVYPLKASSFQGGDLKDNGSGKINVAYDSDGGTQQGAVSYYFATAVKRVEAVQKGPQNNIFNRIQGCTLLGDFSDAPISYGSCSALSIAGTTTIIPLRLGNLETMESTSPALNAVANGDASGDDGVASFPIIEGGHPNTPLPADYTVNVTASNVFGSDASIFAWIDWNGNGIFESSEGLSQTIANGTTNGTFAFTWPMGTIVTGNIGATGTYARFRISNDVSLTLSTSAVNTLNGEIEDYFIPFLHVLPLDLLSFQVDRAGSKAKLNWSTTNELSIRHFIIDHSSDGIAYNEIGRVMVNNMEGQTNNYNFTHQQITKGYNYYRLKMVDKDGGLKYSPTRLIRSTGEVGMIASPNPTARTSKLTGLEVGMEIKLFGSDGRLIQKQVVSSSTGIIDMALLLKGVYIVTITGNDRTEVIRIIKQ